MRWSSRTSAKTVLAGAGIALAMTSGTGVSAAIPFFYPPGDPGNITIVFPPVTFGGGQTIVQPGGGSVYAPQLPASAIRPLIGPGMYPVQSPTGAAPIATTVAPDSPFQMAGMVVIALGVVGYAARRRQLVPA